ncbi:DUF2515 family protein [Bacillus kexueae]|uniref:DUF2515 family protein n=1 Tax=Aeribacillus kexueae TaxID=2078952 RepID=UPI001FAFCF42|nr:DUF2515 family protein [Bacillus kexueae]
MNERLMIRRIQHEMESCNIDNISRTISYAKFYERNPEIKWAFLASMVSRNAGWCMTDLLGTWCQKALSDEFRYWLFLTYEKANWLIFRDAFPQLLIYELSKKKGKPLFHLVEAFSVSSFMKREWEIFFKNRNEKRLLLSLIINEQHLIQLPVIEDRYFNKYVFKSFPYRFQDLFHFNTVLFPTLDGQLYGCTVKGFRKVHARIQLGKCLAAILFHPLYYEKFHLFSNIVPHTGSRYDFERYLPIHKTRETPFLRTAYPIVSHHIDERESNWFHGQRLNHFYGVVKTPKQVHLTDWYLKKQEQLRVICLVEEYLKGRKG